MNKPNNIVRAPTSSLKDGTFFKLWLIYMRPYHNLTNREIEVATGFLQLRYELAKAITDKDLLDKVVMSEDTKKKIREDCNISLAHFQVVMSKLRENKFIVNNRINLKFVPNTLSDAMMTDNNTGKKYFQLLYLCEVND